MSALTTTEQSPSRGPGIDIERVGSHRVDTNDRIVLLERQMVLRIVRPLERVINEGLPTPP